MKIIFGMVDRINEYLKKKDLEKIYARVSLIVLLVLVIPMLALSFYNIPNDGDDIAHTLGAHVAWMGDHTIHGFFMAVVAAWQRMSAIYMTWGGNYTSFFFSSLQPVVFSEKLAFVGTFLFIGGLSFGEYQFLKETVCQYFGMRKNTVLLLFGGIMILNTQYLTSARQAFFWYSGCVTNTLGFGATLLLLTMLCKTYRLKKMTVGRCIGGMLLSIFIAGCNYSSLMSLLIILFFYGITVAFDKEITKKDKIMIYAVIVVLLIGMAISITAPGNAKRQSMNEGSSALFALTNAILQGRDLWFSYMNAKVIAFTLLFVPFVWNQLDEKKEYRFPLLLLVISVGIFCAALTPTMKSDSNYGPRRTRNLYWWIFLNLYLMNLIYCMGWLKAILRKKFSERKFVFAGNHQVGMLVAAILLILCTIQIEDVKAIPFTQATLDLVSGRAQRFGRQMEDRYQLYYSEDKDITVDYIDYVPQLFVEEDNYIYANEQGTTVPGEYYKKDSITVK